jgi:hypothetical protein
MQMPPGSANASSLAAILNAVTEDVAVLDDYIAEVDPIRKLMCWSSGISALRSIIARWISAAQRTASTTLGNSHQHPIAGILHDPAAMYLDLRINQLTEMCLEKFVRPLLVRAHQTRIACHVGGEDRGETAFDGLLHSFLQQRRTWQNRNR